jgi:putative oxidoreductase
MKILTKNFTGTSNIALLMRILTGIIFFAHGAQKVLGWYGGKGLAVTVEMFQSNLGIPPFLAYAVSFTEFLGGFLLILGIFTRIFSAGLVIDMIVAVLRVHLPKGLFTSNSGFEFPLTLLLLSFCIFLTGPGKVSIDYLLFGYKKNEEPAQFIGTPTGN